MPKKPSSPAKTCIFCEGTPLSKEHFWPDWANSLIQVQSKDRLEFFWKKSAKEGIVSSKQHKRDGATKVSKLRAPCKACNNGWMSVIEEKTKPILSKMIAGDAIILDSEHQLKLATWITLKMIVAEHHMKKPPVTPLAARRAFMANHQPLENSKIFIGICKAPRWQAQFEVASMYLGSGAPVHQSELANRADNAQTITFGIGRLFIHANHAVDLGVRLDLQNRNDAQLAQIWPIVKSEIYWPPIREVTLFDAEFISNGLHRFYESVHASG